MITLLSSVLCALDQRRLAGDGDVLGQCRHGHLKVDVDGRPDIDSDVRTLTVPKPDSSAFNGILPGVSAAMR